MFGYGTNKTISFLFYFSFAGPYYFTFGDHLDIEAKITTEVVSRRTQNQYDTTTCLRKKLIM